MFIKAFLETLWYINNPGKNKKGLTVLKETESHHVKFAKPSLKNILLHLLGLAIVINFCIATFLAFSNFSILITCYILALLSFMTTLKIVTLFFVGLPISDVTDNSATIAIALFALIMPGIFSYLLGDLNRMIIATAVCFIWALIGIGSAFTGVHIFMDTSFSGKG